MKHNHSHDSLPVPSPAERAVSAQLIALIREKIIAAGGWLSFDRYMSEALYAPGLGYYSGDALKFGWRAADGSDFITAPELSPLFATTLARTIAQALAASATSQIMEFGAGSGKLAAGILNELNTLGVPLEQYSIVELSGELRARQRETIESRASSLSSHVQWLDTLPTTFEGIVLGNEVLDAMPVRLFTREQDSWREQGVVLAADEKLVLESRPLAADAAQALRLESIETHDDYVTETHEASEAFVRTVCAMLTRGAAFFIDYGFPRHEYYHPQRAQGTLMCHYRHHAHGDPLVYPGLQDITAHVEFSGIAEAGVQAGATLLGYTSQARFLLNAGIIDALATLDPANATVFLPAANAVQKLLSEAEMGELFKVIAFGQGIDALDVFAQGDRSHTL